MFELIIPINYIFAGILSFGTLFSVCVIGYGIITLLGHWITNKRVNNDIKTILSGLALLFVIDGISMACSFLYVVTRPTNNGFCLDAKWENTDFPTCTYLQTSPFDNTPLHPIKWSISTACWMYDGFVKTISIKFD